MRQQDLNLALKVLYQNAKQNLSKIDPAELVAQ
jgi:hypothetical protein